LLCSLLNYPNIIKNGIDTYIANNKGYILMVNKKENFK
jgi:hypothetical protein